MKKTIYCKHCCGEITSKADLIVTTHLLRVVPYHQECFAKEMKTINSMFLDKPINSSFTTICVAIVSAVLLALSAFIPSPQNLIIIFGVLVGAMVRAYSWLAYERYLP